MLNFQEVFDLNDAISEQVNGSVIGLRIVGEERHRGGILILCWDVESGRTVIASYSIDQNKLENIIFQHDTSIFIKSASLNSEGTLLACTIQLPPRKDVKEYETWLIEVKPQNRIFSLGVTTKSLQRVLFFDSQDYNISRWNLSGKDVRTDKILHICHQESVQVYSLTTGKIPNDGWAIKEQPRKERIIAKNHVWCHWDLHTQTLFYIYSRSSRSDTSNYFLRTIQLGNRGSSAEAASKNSIKYFFDKPAFQLYSSLWAEMELALPDFSDGSSIFEQISNLRYHDMKILRISTAMFDGLALLVGKFDPSTKNLKVYIVYWKCEKGAMLNSDSVPMNVVCGSFYKEQEVPFKNWTKNCVFFGNIGHLVVVFTPETYLYFFDLFDNHVPILFPLNAVSNHRKLFSGIQINEPQSIECIYCIPNDNPEEMSFATSVYSKKTKKIYTYEISLDGLLSLMATDDDFCQQNLNFVIHLLKLHMKVPEKILHNLLKSVLQKNFEIMDAIIELLLAESYLGITDYMFDRKFLMLIPVTGMLGSQHELSNAAFECSSSVKKVETKTVTLISPWKRIHEISQFNYGKNILNLIDIPSKYCLGVCLSFDTPWIQILSEELERCEIDEDLQVSMNPRPNKTGLLSRLLFNDASGTSLPNSSSGNESDKGYNACVQDLRSKSEHLVDFVVENYPKTGIGSLSSIGSSSSPGNISKSLKSALSSRISIYGRDNFSKKDLVHFSREYLQIQRLKIAYLWNYLSDILKLPRISQFNECSCYNCFRIHDRVQKKDSMTSPYPSSSYSGFKQSHIHSRYQFVSNIMRQTSQNRGIPALSPNFNSRRPQTASSACPFVPEERQNMFDTVESFFMALEYLAATAPVGASGKYALLGFHTLPRQ